ncbi:MAG: YfdX family protein [Burkholderiaceae bacterium]
MKLQSIPRSKRSRSAAGLGAYALAAALGLAVLPPFASATTPPAATQDAAASATPRTVLSDEVTKALEDFSKAGQDAIDNVRLARLALFDGRTDEAVRDMKSAQKSLAIAKAEAPTFSTRTEVKVSGKLVGVDKDRLHSDMVPIDGDLLVQDKMRLTEKHRPFLEKARELLHMGDKASAAKVLKAGDIGVSYQRHWLMLSDAGKNLDQAISLAAQKKFFEANLALKGVEDQVLSDTIDFDVPPAKAAS